MPNFTTQDALTQYLVFKYARIPHPEQIALHRILVCLLSWESRKTISTLERRLPILKSIHKFHSHSFRWEHFMQKENTNRKIQSQKRLKNKLKWNHFKQKKQACMSRDRYVKPQGRYPSYRSWTSFLHSMDAPVSHSELIHSEGSAIGLSTSKISSSRKAMRGLRELQMCPRKSLPDKPHPLPSP